MRAAMICVGLMAPLATAGCVSTQSVVYRSQSEGAPRVVVTCNGRFSDITDCYARAKQKCNGAFDVVSEKVETKYDAWLFSGFMCGRPAFSVQWRELDVKCGPATSVSIESDGDETPPSVRAPGKCGAKSDCPADQECVYTSFGVGTCKGK